MIRLEICVTDICVIIGINRCRKVGSVKAKSLQAYKQQQKAVQTGKQNIRGNAGRWWSRPGRWSQMQS